MQPNCQDIQPKIGVLLVQLGTPDEATPEAVRRYLKEFLWDPRVVDVNRVLWWFILNFIILNTRPKKSAALYRRLFETYGPVLLTYTQSLARKIQKQFSSIEFAPGSVSPLTQLSASKIATGSVAQLKSREQVPVVVEFAMRYGNPSLKSVIRKMAREKYCDRILVVPLYPQYASATSGSIADAVFEELRTWRWVPALRIMGSFATHPEFLMAQARRINDALQARQKKPDRVIFSYHGIPERYVRLGDPYACECLNTTDALKGMIDFPAENILHCYQSRFGKEEWLKPYTDATLIELAQSGVKDVMVACPSFTMDCLETLDEIAVENRHVFQQHGGERLELVSCVNDHDDWAQGLSRMISAEISSWLD